jgi:hypothetical protein
MERCNLGPIELDSTRMIFRMAVVCKSVGSSCRAPDVNNIFTRASTIQTAAQIRWRRWRMVAGRR